MTKRPANWKALAGVAAAGTIGLGGLALADPGQAETPPPITLTDIEAVTTSAPAGSPGPTIIIPSDLDSPFDDTPETATTAGAEDSGDEPDDSPEASPADDPAGGEDSPPEGGGSDSPDDSPDGSGGS
ncbi:MAG TPA: hypothetical protein VJR05_05755 [Acidimicrobiia bacterium]|nr:hypothetical protein [Acidimicrobiia bacterium]